MLNTFLNWVEHFSNIFPESIKETAHIETRILFSEFSEKIIWVEQSRYHQTYHKKNSSRWGYGFLAVSNIISYP